MKMPAPDEVRLFRVDPVVISVLDYSKGFGHTELVTVGESAALADAQAAEV